MKTEFDKVIGGFTLNNWHSPASGELFNDETGKSFLFSLDLKEKYKCKNPENSIFYTNSYRTRFLCGADLRMYDDTHKNNNSYANFPDAYNMQVNGANKYQNNQQT